MMRIPLYIRVLLGCYLTLNAVVVPAQPAGTEWLTTKQGLSQGYINSIVQDSEGFIWIGTKNGLNRYDGYRFEVFIHDPYDDHSLSDDFINSLSEHGDFLIVGTVTGGLNLFHKKTRQVYRIPNEALLPGLPHDYVSILWAKADAEGNIWTEVDDPTLFTRLCKITLPPGFWEKPAPDWRKGLQVKLWPQLIWGITCLANDAKSLYAPVRDTLFQIDAHTNRWTQVARLPEGRQVIDTDTRGNVWITRLVDDGLSELYRIKPGSSFVPERMPAPRDFYRIQHFTQDRVWIACHGRNEVFRLDSEGNFDPTRPEFPAVEVPRGHSYGMTDRSGLVWMGTNGVGIIKINLRSRHFRHLFPGKSIYGAVTQDRQGNTCTYSNLVELLSAPESANSPLLRGLTKMHSSTKALADNRGNFWVVGTHSNTQVFMLKKIDPAGRLTVFPIPLWVHNRDNIVAALDEKDHPWIAVDKRLIHFDPTTEHFDTLDFKTTLPEAMGVTALARSADGSWWIGTDKGLVRAKPDGQGFDFSAFKNDATARNSLRHNHVACLLTDPADPAVLWIGTKGGGLNRLDTRNLQFTHLTTREGLPNDVIYGVLPDEAGNLWMSSNKGLIRYDPASGLIINYTQEDGVQDNEFNTWAYGKGPTGQLMFGGINGLTVFDPRSLLADTPAPQVLITGLRLNDRGISWNDPGGVLTQGVEFTRQIAIPFSRNNLTLEFAAMNFAAPANNRFRYYLDGAEKEWAHESAEHTANYLNLSPGTYVFRVKATNSEGVWSEQAAALEITVLPPWYRSWWAWIAYVLLLGGSAYWFYRFQLGRKLEHAENERLKELDLVKTRLYTNITHEFRTPLTVILGMTEQMQEEIRKLGMEKLQPGTSAKQPDGKASTDSSFSISNFLIANFNNPLSLIRRNGQNLLRLINQVLDLSKLETGNMRLNPVQSDVIAFVKYLTESFQSFAAGKKIQLHFGSKTAELNMAYDPEKIQAIVSNLISNAIKFTPENGHIYVQTRAAATGEQPVFELSVRDTGVGIPAEKLPHVFDRFYQVDNSATRAGEGSGIGLALVRELVKLMGGQIGVESRPGAGSVFTVTLPVRSGGAPATVSAREVSMPLPAAPLRATAGPEPDDPVRPLLLIVEDNSDVREYLVHCLREQYQLIEAVDGQAGIEQALERVPDLVISDVMMPQKDGFELCQTLKNDDRSSHIPIVLLTAKADVASRIEGLTRGADDYVAKPFERLELLVRVRNLLDNRRRLQARYGQGFIAGEVAAAADEIVLVEDAFLQKLRGIVEERLNDSEFDMNRLSRAAGMSHSQIFRKLKALTGRSPSAFIRSVRLHHARQLLQNTALTVAEVAYETGFTSPNYFATVFQEEFGRTPSESR